MKMTGVEIVEAHSALEHMDFVEEVKDGKTEKRWYKYPSPLTRLQIAKTLKKIANAHIELNEEHDKLLRELGLAGGGAAIRKDGKQEPAVLEQFNEKWNALLRASQDVNVPGFTVAQLDVEKNQFPATILVGVMALITDAEKVGEKE